MHGIVFDEILSILSQTLRWAWNEFALGWIKTRGWILIVRARARERAPLVFADGPHEVPLWLGIVVKSSIAALWKFLVRSTILRVLRVYRLRGAGYDPGRRICVHAEAWGLGRKMCRAWGLKVLIMLWGITCVGVGAVAIALVKGGALRAGSAGFIVRGLHSGQARSLRRAGVDVPFRLCAHCEKRKKTLFS